MDTAAEVEADMVDMVDTVDTADTGDMEADIADMVADTADMVEAAERDTEKVFANVFAVSAIHLTYLLTNNLYRIEMELGLFCFFLR